MSILGAAVSAATLGVLVYVATMLERLVAINRAVVAELRAARAGISTSPVPIPIAPISGDFNDESTRPIGSHNRPTPQPLPPEEGSP